MYVCLHLCANFSLSCYRFVKPLSNEEAENDEDQTMKTQSLLYDTTCIRNIPKTQTSAEDVIKDASLSTTLFATQLPNLRFALTQEEDETFPRKVDEVGCNELMKTLRDIQEQVSASRRKNVYPMLFTFPFYSLHLLGQTINVIA